MTFVDKVILLMVLAFAAVNATVIEAAATVIGDAVMAVKALRRSTRWHPRNMTRRAAVRFAAKVVSTAANEGGGVTAARPEARGTVPTSL